MNDPGAPPRTLGPYRLERLLGQGGMGEVWLAHDARLERRVAIKHVKDAEDGARRRARFRREAKAAAQLAHPSIVPVFDVLEDERGDWIVMEWVDGPSLRDLSENEPLSVPDALRYGRQIAEGLAAAHAVGVVHRDLKTENVMIAPSGHAKILDFGLAKRTDEAAAGGDGLTARGEIMGTARAMSPEQARGLAVDARSDLFALGILLYEVTTGRSPFLGANSLDTLSRVTSQEPVSPLERRPDLPLAFSRLIQELLEKAPERRPQTAALVASRLAVLLAECQSGDAAPSADPRWEAETLIGEQSDGSVAVGGPGIGAVRHSQPVSAAGRGASEAASPSGPTAGSSTFEPADTSGAYQPASRASTVRRPAGPWWRLAMVVALAGGVGWLAWLAPRPPAEGPVSDGAPSLPSTREVLAEARGLLAQFDDRGSLERAGESLQALVAREPQNAAAHATLADVFLRRFLMERDPAWADRSLGLARRAVDLEEHLAAAHVALGAALRFTGEPESGAESLKYALVLDPDNPRGRLELADLYFGEGRTAEAEDMLRAVLDDDLAEAEHFDLLGTVVLRRGDAAEAEALFRHSIETAPQRVLGHRNLSAALFEQGRLGEAARVLQDALEIRPQASLFTNLGTLLFAQGLYPQAADAFDRALQIGSSHSPLMWLNLGDAHRFIPGHEDEARTAFRRARQLLEGSLDAQPANASARSRLALVLAKLGDGKAARPEIEAVRMLPAPDPTSLYRIAVASEILGDRPAALRLLGRALEGGYSPSSVAADPELADLRRDTAYHRLLASDL